MPRRRNRNSESISRSIDNANLTGPNEEHYIVVLFADIVGCSEISNNKGLTKYNEFVSSFQKIFDEVCEYHKKHRYYDGQLLLFENGARGDEGCAKIISSKNNGDELPRDVDIAIKIAFDLKRKWLIETDNSTRINNGLLPVDLGIGIHAGKVYVNKIKSKDGKYLYRPEGYAINLAKRVESASREGNFTHILLSEAARGQLYNLKDEPTYFFNTPFPINPKGFSKGIKVYEVKHHFLSTNWYDSPSESTMQFDEIDNKKIGLLKMAYETNPTNLWMAEEYIIQCQLNAEKISRKGGKKEDIDLVYESAYDVARRIANSELRDAATLAIWGMIEGDMENFKEEEKKYEEAVKLDEQNGNIRWYFALSKSYLINIELFHQNIKKFHNENRPKIDKIFSTFDKASNLTPFNPWIKFDYACELSKWSKADEQLYREKAINMLILALQLNSDTKEEAKKESYLKPIIEDPKVRKHLL